MPRPKGSTREERFVLEYPKDLNGTAAATRAGFSAKTAAVTASKLLRKPNVAAKIQAALDARAKKAGVTAEFVLNELLRLAGLDVAEAFDENGKLKAIRDIPEDTRRAISSVEVDSRWEGKGEDAELVTTRKLRFWPKDRALELLGKHLKLFTEVHEHHLGDGLAERIKKGRERVASKR